LFGEAKSNHFANSWREFFQRARLRVTTWQRRDSRHVVAVLILFDDHCELPEFPLGCGFFHALIIASERAGSAESLRLRSVLVWKLYRGGGAYVPTVVVGMYAPFGAGVCTHRAICVPRSLIAALRYVAGRTAGAYIATKGVATYAPPIVKKVLCAKQVARTRGFPDARETGEPS